MANANKLGRRLSRAVSKGEMIFVERLLAEGADPNYESIFFPKPLVSARKHQYTSIMLALIEAGADVRMLFPSLGWFAQKGETAMGRSGIVLVSGFSNCWQMRVCIVPDVCKCGIRFPRCGCLAGSGSGPRQSQ